MSQPVHKASSTANLVAMEDPSLLSLNKHEDGENGSPTVYSSDVEIVCNSRDLLWGWRSFRPWWLQFLNSPKWFLFVLCLFGFLQGMAVNTFINMSFPSLEKQFSMTSKETGFIASSNDITALTLVIFVSFFGSYGHKTKWLGGGAILTGLGALVYALPHFVSPKHDPTGAKQGGTPFCLRNTSLSAYKDPDCGTATENVPMLYYALFIISQLMSGAGTTPLHTLGPAYLDENVPSISVGAYLAVFYLAGFMGPGIGSIIGGQFLTVYVDISPPPDIKLTPAHPMWIGAWWLGPASCGLMIILLGVVMLGFPRRLPGANAVRKEMKECGETDDRTLTGGIKDILPATKELLTNGTYMFQNMGITFSTLVGFGIFPFIFKFVTGRYGASALVAGVALAFILIPACALGLFSGSYLVKRFRVRRSCTRAAKLTAVLQIIGVWGSLVFLVPGCQYSNYVGVDVPYINSSVSSITIDNACNAGCLCSKAQFSPVKSGEKTTFYSPCYAGCPPQKRTKEGYTGCACTPPMINATGPHPNATSHLKPGIYQEACSLKYLVFFSIGSFLTIVFGFMNGIPSKIVSLRSVPDTYRAYGLGLQFVFMRTIGALPGPVIIGTIIDHTCTLWKTKCDKPANCLNYDYDKLGYIITAYGLPTHLLSLLCYYLSYHFSKNKKFDGDGTLTKSNAAEEMGNIDKKDGE
ncbi:solute carrier organic anion transporter family member 4A1 isoform X2 [Nematostella vectensis]|nr:solute carrier organic anion transporter family member 4A1 isoform X2 [Nematostella vectensis]XP_048583448.1 solute carrier organic anion transporter family member 4A1 isoform X2 [Nematostella vectensis]